MAETHASGGLDPTALYSVAIAIILGAVLISGAVYMSVGALNQTLFEKSLTATVSGAGANTGGNANDGTANGGSNAGGNNGGTAGTQPPPSGPSAPKTVNLALSGRPVDGSANAKVTLVEFSEFLCPYCINVHPTVVSLETKYASQMNAVHMNFIIHGDPAKYASAGVECAGDQGKYYQMHDAVFDSKGTKVDKAGLDSVAANLSLDMAKFDACLDGGSKNAVIDAEQAQGNAVGVSGTPSFVVLTSSHDDATKARLQQVASSLVSTYYGGQESSYVVDVPGRGYGIFFVGALPEAAFTQAIDAAVAS